MNCHFFANINISCHINLGYFVPEVIPCNLCYSERLLAIMIIFVKLLIPDLET